MFKQALSYNFLIEFLFLITVRNAKNYFSIQLWTHVFIHHTQYFSDFFE